MSEFYQGSLFGRRKGKPLSRSQHTLMQNLLPILKIDVSGESGIDPIDLFQVKYANCWLEIGFGSGEHLIHLLNENPDVGIIGCEPYVSGLAKILKRIESCKFTGRVRLFDGDATLLLDSMEPASMGRIYLLYPDPWPKRKHWKRRFVSRTNLEKLARVMKTGAELRIASDIDSYSDWILQHIHANSDFEWTARCSADWRKPWQDWPSTRYEAKALREGRHPTYLVFRRN